MNNHPLIYGKQYHLWREGVYIGIATYTDDDTIGDAFVSIEIREGNRYKHVYVADRWELISNQ